MNRAGYILQLLLIYLISSVTLADLPDGVQYYQLGLQHLSANKLNKAEQYLLNAIIANKRDPMFYTVLADVQIQLGKTKEAIKNYKKALSLTPKNPIVMSMYANTLKDLKQYDQAISYYQQAMQMDSKLQYLSADIGQLFYLTGDYANALRYLEIAESINPSNGQILSCLIDSEMALGAYDRAHDRLISILQKDGNNYIALNKLADIYFQKQKIEQAESVYRKVLQIEPNDLNSLLSLAQIRGEYRSDPQEALQLLRKAQSLAPEDADLNYNLAKSYAKNAAYKDAVNAISIAIGQAGNETEKQKYQIELINYLVDLHEYERAEILIKEILNKSKGNLILLRQLADLKLGQKKYQEAQQLYWKLLESNPQYKTDSSFLSNYALSFQGMESWEQASIVWRDYLQYQPNDFSGWLDLIRVEIALDHQDQALEYYQTIKQAALSERSEHIPDILKGMAELYRMQNNFLPAENAYRELILYDMQPEYIVELIDIQLQQNKINEALLTLEKYELEGVSSIELELKKAELTYLSGDSWQAAEQYQQILSVNPDNILAMTRLGDIYLDIGQFNEAAGIYKKVASLDPENFHVQFNYALALIRQDQRENAIAEYKKAINIDPLYPDTYYSLGALYVELDNMPMAKKYFTKYIELDPRGSYRSEVIRQFPELKQL